MGTPSYSREFKEAIVKRLCQSKLSLREFARQEGINLSTLYNWQKQFNVPGSSVKKIILPDQWSADKKFAVVLESATLAETELSEYCRSNGLYPEQVTAWKQACIAANARPANANKQALLVNHQSDKKRIKALEKELSRKEKALAETAALLVLRKKFNAYYEEDEDK